MTAYAAGTDPYAAYRQYMAASATPAASAAPVAAAPLATTWGWPTNATVVFGADAPAQPTGALASISNALSKPSPILNIPYGYLGAGALAIGALIYGANTHWFGLAEPAGAKGRMGARHAARHGGRAHARHR